LPQTYSTNTPEREPDADDARSTKKSDDNGDLLKVAAERYEAALSRERENIEAAYLDLRLLAGDDVAHWGEGVREQRAADNRPCLKVNRTGQFVKQITGDIRQMRPSIRCVAVDSRAAEEIADINAGLIRYIEHRSSASSVYNKAADSQVACGVGAWRVITEYAADSTFNQEIRISSVDDPVMVLFDPDAIELSRADAMFAFVPSI
jgi:hypothetical protein